MTFDILLPDRRVEGVKHANERVFPKIKLEAHMMKGKKIIGKCRVDMGSVIDFVETIMLGFLVLVALVASYPLVVNRVGYWTVAGFAIAYYLLLVFKFIWRHFDFNSEVSKVSPQKANVCETIEEHKFTNQHWVTVLDEIWAYAPNKWGIGNKGYDDSHPLAKRLKINGYELMQITSFLEEQKLIEYDKQTHNWIEITSKGFDVALQNRNAERSDRTNKGSLFLSLAIAVFAVVSLLLGIQNWDQRLTISILIVIALIAGGWSVRRF